MQISYTLNGSEVNAAADGRRLLVHHLRDDRGLTGTHVGCDTSQCGACTVLVDGLAVKSCTLLAAQIDGHEVVTIEGLARDGDLHPVQRAFAANHALQCGFCTPGMVMTAIDLIARHGPSITESDVRHGLHGNLCRCTGYQFIVDAVLAAAAAEAGAGAGAEVAP